MQNCASDLNLSPKHNKIGIAELADTKQIEVQVYQSISVILGCSPQFVNAHYV